MQVYVICRCGCEEHSIYAVCGTESRAREMYEKLRSELIREITETIEYSKDDKDYAGSSFPVLYQNELDYLDGCRFPNERKRPGSAAYIYPATEIYEVLE